jgi:RNA polymerase sigma-70 factor (ECF subfamily)
MMRQAREDPVQAVKKGGIFLRPQYASAMARTPDHAGALVAQLPALRRYAVALTGNAALADDLVQDCLERALRHGQQLQEVQSLAAWLRRILHNLYIDEIRRRRGRFQDISEMADTVELSIPAQDNAAAGDFIKAINALNLEQRQIVLLAGLEELSYREIAEELGIPVGTVMSRLARARARLRELLEHGEDAKVIPLSRVKP